MSRKVKLAGWWIVILAVFFPAGVMAKDEKVSKEEEKKLKEEVKQELKVFRKDFRAARTESGKAEAVRKLAGREDSKIASELLKMLKYPLGQVRREAAAGLGRYQYNVKLSDVLVRLALAEKDQGVAIAYLEAVGKIGSCRGVAKLADFYSKNIPLATKAIQISGQIKSRDLIYPLIREMGKLERTSRLPDNNGLPGGGGGPIPRNMEDDSMKRKEALLPEVKDALGAITQERFSNSKQYKEWWKRSGRIFLDPGQKRQIEAKRQKEEERKEEVKAFREKMKAQRDKKKQEKEEKAEKKRQEEANK